MWFHVKCDDVFDQNDWFKCVTYCLPHIFIFRNLIGTHKHMIGKTFRRSSPLVDHKNDDVDDVSLVSLNLRFSTFI